jgi:UDP-glucose 4-epimerase
MKKTRKARTIKSVVTGGAGFIGSHLTELLLGEGHCVTVIDDLSTGRKRNLRDITQSRALTFVRADVNDTRILASALRGAAYVFHLAARADIVPSIVDPLSYYRANVDGTASVLETVRAVCPDLKKFLYAASSSCYGVPDIYPTPENAALHPEYPYALTKILGEQLSLHWAQVYKLPVVSLRLFNVYGPRARTSGTYGAVLGVFLAQKLANKPYTVVGDGRQTRDFTYVTDVCRAFLAAAQSRASNEIFNVGSGNTHSVNRLVELLGGTTTHIPKRPGEPGRTFADISKIRKILKWEPGVTFEQGVAAMLKDISYWKGAPVWTPETIRKATKEWFTYLSR